MLVVFALFLAATPFATIALYVRLRSVRRQLLKLTDLSVEVTDGLRRDLLELKRQVDAAAGTAAAVKETPSTAHATTVAPASAPSADPASKVNQLRTTADAQSHGRSTPGPSVPSVPSVVKTSTEPATHFQKPAPVKPSEPPPVVTHAEAKPSIPTPEAPVVPPTPALSPATPPPLSRTQMPPATPTSPAAPPQAVPAEPPAGRAATPPHAAPPRPSPPAHSYTVSAMPPKTPPKKSSEQRMKSVFALEEVLGTNWLNKIGIILIVLAVAYFGIKELGHLGPLGKVALSYVISLGLLGGGIVLEKRQRYRVFSYAFIGGGWALLFWTTYALNHVEAMRILGSVGTDLILMFLVAMAMVMHTLRYRSQVVTGMAFLLAYWTVGLSNDDVYSLTAGAILAIALVAIILKLEWFELEAFGVLSSYSNHVYWLYRLLGPGGAQGREFPDYHASTAILFLYWITYRISYVIRKPKSAREEHISTVAALLNTLLLLGALKFQSVRPELAFWALLIIGAIEFTIGQLPLLRKRREAFVVLSVLGAALMIGSVPFRYTGNNVAILWLIGAEVFLAAGVLVGEVVFRRLGLFAGLLVGLHLVAIDFQELMVARRVSDEIELNVGVMFAFCAAVFYLNTFFVGSRWPQFFTDVPDAPMLFVHSYAGAFAAACAAWALFSGDRTALAFAGVMLALAALGQRLKIVHLQLQYGALGLLALYRVVVVNLHSDIPQYTHVQNRLITLPILAAAFYITAKLAATSENNNQRTFRGLFAFAGTALISALIYYEVPELWQPLAAIAFAVLLLEVGQRIGYPALAWHAHVLSGLAVLAAISADASGAQRWHDIPLHALSALPVVAGAYWIAHRIKAPEAHVAFTRIAYSWAATGLMVWLLNEATPAPWIAVAWIVFAIALALALRQIGYRQLGWQANAVAACALIRAFSFNLELQQTFWLGISLRLTTISIVAAGLYFLSRASTTDDSGASRAISYLHTFAATTLLTFLAWHEAGTGWLAPLWAMFALVLALVDRRFQLEDLRWQAHGLALLTMARSVTVNLYVVETWHSVSLRLLSLSIVGVLFYAMSQIVRMPEEFRRRDFPHIYSWAASTLVSLLLWYELQTLSIAVGWAVFGLILFEYGLWRKVRQFRLQAYVALAASFGRIFFANLTAGSPGEFWGPRLYTVLPITLILFFVYAQLADTDPTAGEDRALRFDVLVAYLGTGTVVALLYFQFANEWLVTAWAVVVFILFGCSLLLNRAIFLHQALLLTLGACGRGVMHNLFGASYFTGTDWIGRISVLGSAIAIMLACLPFAYRWRDRQKTLPESNRIAAVVRRPEQFMFFAPVILLTLMLALKMRAGMVTVAWGIEALAIIFFAFTINERSFRLTGMLLLLTSFAKILVLDMWAREWTWADRYVTFFIVGVAMVSASFLYTRYREKIRQFL